MLLMVRSVLSIELVSIKHIEEAKPEYWCTRHHFEKRLQSVYCRNFDYRWRVLGHALGPLGLKLMAIIGFVSYVGRPMDSPFSSMYNGPIQHYSHHSPFNVSGYNNALLKYCTDFIYLLLRKKYLCLNIFALRGTATNRYNIECIT